MPAASPPNLDKVYRRAVQPSIPPERVLQAPHLMTFYTVLSERPLGEQLDNSLLFQSLLAESMTGPKLKVGRKGNDQAAKLRCRANALIENRNR